MPLSTLEIVMLHQIPLRPRGVRIKAIASGIRKAVKTILVMEGGKVCPSPAKAPAVVISTLIKS